VAFNGRAFIRDFMCRQVRISQVLRRVHDVRGEKWWEPAPLMTPMIGWVVGVTHLQTGHRTPGDPSYQNTWAALRGTDEWEGTGGE